MKLFKKKTISEILDKQQQEAEEKFKEEKEERERKYEKGYKEIEDTINFQFSRARQIIGHRLTIKKDHETMYKFYFDSNKHDYGMYMFAPCLVFPGQNTIFDVNPYSFRGKDKIINYGRGNKIKLFQLADYLIDWVNFIIENE